MNIQMSTVSLLRNSNIPQKDAYCGLRRDLFPAPNCTTSEELNDVVCFGLSHEPWPWRHVLGKVGSLEYDSAQCTSGNEPVHHDILW